MPVRPGDELGHGIGIEVVETVDPMATQVFRPGVSQGLPELGDGVRRQKDGEKVA
jgi:hypothetical protein